MTSEIINFIKTVPGFIWSALLASGIALFGVIVASGITLFGVMISNKSNTSRLTLQLDHDTHEKSKERFSKLRHEVYLKVAEDIEGASIKLSTLVHRDISKLDINSELQEITASIAKLKLVAEHNTTILAGELTVAFVALFLRLLPRLVPVQDAMSDIEIHNSTHAHWADEVSRVQREIQRFKEEGRQDGAVYKYLTGMSQFNSIQAKKSADAGALAYKVHAEKLGEFNAFLLPEMKGLAKEQLKVMVAMREELGIVSDVAELQRQLERQWAVMEAGYSDVMRDLKVG